MSLEIWRGARVVEWARLESECTLYGVPRVRIPPSPHLVSSLFLYEHSYIRSKSKYGQIFTEIDKIHSCIKPMGTDGLIYFLFIHDVSNKKLCNVSSQK